MPITFVSASVSASSSYCSFFDVRNQRRIVPSCSSRTSVPISVPFSISFSRPDRCTRRYGTRISCEVAELKPTENEISSSESDLDSPAAKVGSRVRVKVPLKVYHVPKVPEIDLMGMEGVIKQYVVEWKGKRISANLPFKVEFLAHKVDGRQGPLKFFAHLREDEFEYVD
ncbi:ferredoxin-thioredoxin reductase, variable chain-like [Aristolochia californica]|uniref:ferredoxin-thioredoxin reductase, variable chain-like n=1 Tax=Aristolochia californica TaxID=171875 RepID=UPI0035DF0BA5